MSGKRFSRMRGALLLAFLIASFAANSRAADGLVISEFMAKNDSTLTNAMGERTDWIEIHNGSDGAVDLSGWYLTDEISDPRKWRFPSTDRTAPLARGAYLIVHASGEDDAVINGELHASFKLGSGGEYLALVEPNGEVVAHQFNPEYPAQSADVSYGLDAETGAAAYFEFPTPGGPNARAIAGAVRFSAESRVFTNGFDLTFATDSPTAFIRYTTNGAMPSAVSALYNGAIRIDSTTRVRARAFESGLEQGAVSTEIFYHVAPELADFVSDVPVVVIDTHGAGEIPHGDDGPARQPCGVLFLEPVNGVTRLTDPPAIATRAGVRRRGESTKRDTADKPNLSLETWGELDEDDSSIKPFGLPAESDWVLHAPWTIDTAMMRNSFIYGVSNDSGEYAPRTRHVEVFLNHGGGSLSTNDYYGVYEFMEKIKRDDNRVDVRSLDEDVDAEPEISGGYVFKKDKDDPDDQNFIAAGKTLTAVDPDFLPDVQLAWLTNHINQVDAAIPNGDYEALIDVESFADHHIFNVFANNADGLRVSTFYHKDREGRLRMGPIWDFDRSMGCDVDKRPSDPETWSLSNGAGGGDSRYFFHNGGHLWFRELALNDPDFWVVWVDRWKRLREGPLSESAMVERIETFREELSSAAERNYDRWPLAQLEGTNWNQKVDLFKAHVVTRGRWIDEQLLDSPNMSASGGLVSSGFQVELSAEEAVYFTRNGSDPRAEGGAPVGEPYTGPITIVSNTLLSARAWDGTTFVNAPNTWPWSARSDAMFVVSPASIVITEIMYHPRPPSHAAEYEFVSSDFEFIEVLNIGDEACDLLGLELLDGVDFEFSGALGAGEFGVIVANLAAFKTRYPTWSAMNVLGEYEGRLHDDSEDVELGYDASGMPRLAAFDYEDDWYPCTDGEGFSLVARNGFDESARWDAKGAWRHSSAMDGSPGVADPMPALAPESVVINEVLSHQDQDDPGDWIELRNTTDAAIDLSGWFISDSRADLLKYALPAGTIIPAWGYLTLTEHDAFGSAFALSEHGDSVFLSAGNGSGLVEPAYRESVDFGARQRDVTIGRYVRSDASAVFTPMSRATPGESNASPRVGPIVIEEVMYHPPVGGEEYITLRNISAVDVPLYDVNHASNTWRVAGIDFVFPAGVGLAADERLILLRDDNDPADFRARYSIPKSVKVLLYEGALNNDAETIELRAPGDPENATGYVPYITVEKMKFNNDAPWPTSADGAGKALGRVDAAAFANDVANWAAIDPSFAPIPRTLVVRGGHGSGAYSPGTSVTVQWNGADDSFGRWIGNTATIDDVLAPSATLVMPDHHVTVTALSADPAEFIAADAVWRYHDQGADLGTAWRAMAYDDADWSTGAAQLGYGDNGDATTEIGYGADSKNKHITSYFRRAFHVDHAEGFGGLLVELMRDDGAIVYLNGAEVLRENMPAGTVSYQTRAASTVGGSAESVFFDFEISAEALQDGVNVLAVEMHQRSPTSSDLSFALRLSGLPSLEPRRLDGDADGLTDGWEVDYFGTTEAGTPLEDSDGDGAVNSNEYIAGTSPMDAASIFQIEGFDESGLFWTPVSGRVYSVYWSADPSEPFEPLAVELVDGSFLPGLTNRAGFFKLGVERERE